MSNAPPSANPNDLDDLTGAFRLIFGKMMEGIDGVLPATVIAYDRASKVATVQPSILVVSTTGETTKRAQVAKVPVFQIGGGGYLIDFNLKPGDRGWILACDRDISRYISSGKIVAPNSMRKKNFADSFFLPDSARNRIITGEDSEHFVLQTEDSSVRIALWPDKVKITAPSGLEVDGPIVCTGPITSAGVVTAASLNISGGSGQVATITGDVKVVGNITATGNITPNVPP